MKCSEIAEGNFLEETDFDVGFGFGFGFDDFDFDVEVVADFVSEFRREVIPS